MNQRKNYIIKKRFQFSFLLPFVLLLLVEAVLIISLFCYLSQDTLTTGYMDSILRVEKTQNFFFLPLFLLSLITGVGMALAGLVVFMYLSHRLAGPVYRFECVLKQFEEGNFAVPVRLRKNDQFFEMESALNRLAQSMSQRLGHIKTDLEEVSSLMSRCDDPAKLTQAAQKIDHLVQEIKHFKTASHPNNEG